MFIVADARRVELGVADELKEVEGITTPMLVKLGENDVKSGEDLADCATDELAGWTERQDKETTRHAGFLDGFGLTRAQCEDLILAARVKAGWIDEADLLPEEPEETEEDGSEDAEGAESAAGEDEASGEDATAS